jgi:hypothetical protein
MDEIFGTIVFGAHTGGVDQDLQVPWAQKAQRVKQYHFKMKMMLVCCGQEILDFLTLISMLLSLRSKMINRYTIMSLASPTEFTLKPQP